MSWILHGWFMSPVIQWPVECEEAKCRIDTSWYFKILMSISIRISIRGRMVTQQRWLEVLQEIHVVQSLPSTWIVAWKRHVSLPEQRIHLERNQGDFQDLKLNWFHWVMDESKCQNVIKKTPSTNLNSSNLDWTRRTRYMRNAVERNRRTSATVPISSNVSPFHDL